MKYSTVAIAIRLITHLESLLVPSPPKAMSYEPLKLPQTMNHPIGTKGYPWKFYLTEGKTDHSG